MGKSPIKISDNKNDIILKALEDSRYEWRTIDGISRQTRIPAEVISKRIETWSEQGIVIRAAKPNKNGRFLYSTIKHYKNKRNLINRILLSLSDELR